VQLNLTNLSKGQFLLRCVLGWLRHFTPKLHSIKIAFYKGVSIQVRVMDYIAFRRLFEEFSKKLEEQHVYYLDSLVGFSVLHERVVTDQSNMKEVLASSELANDKFLDTCSTLYSQISSKDFTPISLSPVMKQGHVKERNQEGGNKERA
jgi:hypothetical protein